jgi:hypothetical protein
MPVHSQRVACSVAYNDNSLAQRLMDARVPPEPQQSAVIHLADNLRGAIISFSRVVQLDKHSPLIPT